MKKLENIIILILILAVGYIYFKDNKEHFLVKFQPYYPITTEINPKFNSLKFSLIGPRLINIKKITTNSTQARI